MRRKILYVLLALVLALAGLALLFWLYPKSMTPLLAWAGRTSAVQPREYPSQPNTLIALEKLQSLGTTRADGTTVESVTITEADLSALLRAKTVGIQGRGLGFVQWRILPDGAILEGEALVPFQGKGVPVRFQIQHTATVVQRGVLQFEPVRVRLGKFPVSVETFRERIWPRVIQQSQGLGRVALDRLFWKPVQTFSPVARIEMGDGELTAYRQAASPAAAPSPTGPAAPPGAGS